MSREAMKLALEALFTYEDDWVDDGLGGVHHNVLYDKNKVFKAITALREALAEQPAQPKYRRGDRLICLETEEYCVIHISGTDRQWVKFPDTHIGVYKNEQLAELFELLPKEIEIEQPAQQDIPDLIAGTLGVSRGTAYDMMREALAGAQQEPVAWISKHGVVYPLDAKDEVHPINELQPLYTSPPAQQETDHADELTIAYMSGVHRGKELAQRDLRNATLDEIATKIEAMPFGDTAASFAVWIRQQRT